jgi:hypothetical protein
VMEWENKTKSKDPVFAPQPGQPLKIGLRYISASFWNKLVWDRCYDFKNIFAEKFYEKIGVFDSKQRYFFLKNWS